MKVFLGLFKKRFPQHFQPVRNHYLFPVNILPVQPYILAVAGHSSRKSV